MMEHKCPGYFALNHIMLNATRITGNPLHHIPPQFFLLQSPYGILFISSSAMVGCGAFTLKLLARSAGSLGVDCGLLGSKRLLFHSTSRARLRERDVLPVRDCTPGAASEVRRPRSSETERRLVRGWSSMEPRLEGEEVVEEGSLMEGVDLLGCWVVVVSASEPLSFCLILSNMVMVVFIWLMQVGLMFAMIWRLVVCVCTDLMRKGPSGYNLPYAHIS